MIVTSADCLKKYGDPKSQAAQAKSMAVLDLGKYAATIPALPDKLYCNKDIHKPLIKALDNVVARGLASQLETWDGCFNIRAKRGGTTYSLHSWGVAIDINAKDNAFGEKPTMGRELVTCFTDAGFEWGGNWGKPDGMHFQLARLP